MLSVELNVLLPQNISWTFTVANSVYKNTSRRSCLLFMGQWITKNTLLERQEKSQESIWTDILLAKHPKQEGSSEYSVDWTVFFFLLKGIVQPKRKWFPFSHSQVNPNLYIFFFCWTQKKMFWIWQNNLGTINCLFTHVLQNILFLCFANERNAHWFGWIINWVTLTMISEYLNILLHVFVFLAFFAYSLNVVRLLVPPSAHHQTPQTDLWWEVRIVLPTRTFESHSAKLINLFFSESFCYF